MLRDIRRIVIATGLVTSFLSVACTSGTNPASERERLARNGTGDIVIGAPFPWSSRPELLYGQGLALAVEEANAEGGIGGRKLRLRKVDDGGVTDRARLVAQELADDASIVAVIGHHQAHVTAAAASIYDVAGLVLISATSTLPALRAQGYRYVFQTSITGLDVGRHMAEFALDRGCRRLAVYYSRDAWGRDLANSFEEFAIANGGEVVARESTDPSQSTNPLAADRVVTKWRERLIDAVFLATPYRQAVPMAVELRKNGFHGPFFGSNALAAKRFISEGGAAVEATVFATSFSPDFPSPEVQRFVQTFQERFGMKPSLTAARGYDAIRVLVHAMRTSGSVISDSVAAALLGMRGWQGVTGAFTFNAAGALTDPTIKTAIIVNGGAHAIVDPAIAPACAAGPETAVGEAW